MGSYTSQKSGPLTRAMELVNLARWHAGDAEAGVDGLLARMLDIGCGQKMTQTLYFTGRNRVEPVDYDVIPRAFHPGDYLKMLRKNGPMRVAKTIGRKTLGIDRRFRGALARRLGVARIVPPTVRQMDATRLAFPDGSFDVIYSFSVFEHLPDPAAVVREVVRTLKPGGVAYLCLHLYTSDDGCHDPRIFSGHRDGIPRWAHLRPAHAAMIRPNAYLNKLSLTQWDALFRELMPGCRLERFKYGGAEEAAELAQVRAGGELSDFTDDELLTSDLAAVWQRPAATVA